MTIKYSRNTILKKLESVTVLNLFNKFNIKSVLIFGSITNDEFNEESDVDLAIVSDNIVDLDDILTIELLLENILNRDVDLIDLRSSSLDLFVKINILNTGKVIYSTDNNELLEHIYNETDRIYKENKNFIYFRKLDVLSWIKKGYQK